VYLPAFFRPPCDFCWYASVMSETHVPKRHFREDVELSVIGFGGMVLVGMEQESGGRLVAESVERGINYFDVAPFYGEGEAEIKLGPALKPFRDRVFLACKTLQRDASGASSELDKSLERLMTDHFDLYQFHALSKVEEVDRIFAPGGALRAFMRAREQGKIRFIGFSAHSVPAALAMIDRFAFDSVLFPVNYISCARGEFGPQVLARAAEAGMGCLALKSMAKGPWKKGEPKTYPKCWYRPIEDRDEARMALRFTLGEGVTALVPPGEESLFRLALDLVPDLAPMSPEERTALLASASGHTPLFSAISR
jgi:aryl-alcohol dehydrogenase-like predicted oxidoreductase